MVARPGRLNAVALARTLWSAILARHAGSVGREHHAREPLEVDSGPEPEWLEVVRVAGEDPPRLRGAVAAVGCVQ